MTLQHEAVLEDVLAALRALTHVQAILAYGSTVTKRWSKGSDIDLIVITSEPAPVESLHFFIGDIPIDLSMRNRAQWEAGDTNWTPPSGLAAIWDPENLLAGVATRQRDPDDARQFRYAHRHMLLKVKRWQSQDPVIAELLAANAVHWVTVSYFHARGMRFPGIDKAVLYFREQEPDMLESLLAATRHENQRFPMLQRACELALEPIGGLWQDDEVFASGWKGNARDEDIALAVTMFKSVVDLGRAVEAES